MTDSSKVKKNSELASGSQNVAASFSNPLYTSSENALSDYSQSLPRNTYDNDMAEILEVVRILNNIWHLSECLCITLMLMKLMEKLIINLMVHYCL